MFSNKLVFPAILTIFIGNSAIASNHDIGFRGSYIASGISRNGIPSEAELQMIENARSKCYTIKGAIQTSNTLFRVFQDVLYASAKFSCHEGPLDRRKCNYPDDSNLHCRE